MKLFYDLIGSLLGQNDEDFIEALQNQDLDTEAPLRYELRGINFVEHTRVAKLTFIKIRTYRTVERYIQRNNQKYKIYTDWKTKEVNTAPITIKLTNDVLENLWDEYFLEDNHILKNEEAISMVSQHAFVIVAKLVEQFESFPMPLWFEEVLLEEEQAQIISNLEANINKLTEEVEIAESKVFNLELTNNKLRNKTRKISDVREKKVLFSIISVITLGIFAYTNSRKLLGKLNLQLSESELETKKIKESISSNLMIIKQNEDLVEKNIEYYGEKIKQLKPLDDYLEISSDFILLKELSGMPYNKIKGVYVIRNRELNKAYVGQSKDVIKRIKNHFAGTVPKNIIFAEDYYNSKYEKKEDLFEFFIEEIHTKDELDNRERELIFEYDAFNSGYNKTSGNQ